MNIDWGGCQVYHLTVAHLLVNAHIIASLISRCSYNSLLYGYMSGENIRGTRASLVSSSFLPGLKTYHFLRLTN